MHPILSTQWLESEVHAGIRTTAPRMEGAFVINITFQSHNNDYYQCHIKLHVYKFQTFFSHNPVLNGKSWTVFHRYNCNCKILQTKLLYKICCKFPTYSNFTNKQSLKLIQPIMLFHNALTYLPKASISILNFITVHK